MPGDILLIDFDQTLNDSDAVFRTKFDGLFGLSGERIMEVYATVHREVRRRYQQERHEDLELHIALLLQQVCQPDIEEHRATLRHRIRLFQQACLAVEAPFEDTFPFLDSVKQEGYTLYLATGDWGREKVQGLEFPGRSELLRRCLR